MRPSVDISIQIWGCLLHPDPRYRLKSRLVYSSVSGFIVKSICIKPNITAEPEMRLHQHCTTNSTRQKYDGSKEMQQ